MDVDGVDLADNSKVRVVETKIRVIERAEKAREEKCKRRERESAAKIWQEWQEQLREVRGDGDTKKTDGTAI